MGYILLPYSQTSFVTRYCANHATLKHYRIKLAPRMAILALAFMLLHSTGGFFVCLDNDILYSGTYFDYSQFNTQLRF